MVDTKTDISSSQASGFMYAVAVSSSSEGESEYYIIIWSLRLKWNVDDGEDAARQSDTRITSAAPATTTTTTSTTRMSYYTCYDIYEPTIIIIITDANTTNTKY